MFLSLFSKIDYSSCSSVCVIMVTVTMAVTIVTSCYHSNIVIHYS